MITEQLDKRHLRRWCFGECCRKGRGLGQPQPHPQPDRHQQDGPQKRQPPAPGAEILFRKPQPQHQEQAIRRQEPQGRAELRKHAESTAPARRSILHRQQRRAAPLPAQPEALPEAQQAEQRRRHPADRIMAGQKGDEEGGKPHDQQRRHQRALAPHPVPEMPERERPDRPGDERHGKARIGRQQLCRGTFRRKEQRPEHQRRRRGVDIEIIELDRRAGEAGGQDSGVLLVQETMPPAAGGLAPRPL